MYNYDNHIFISFFLSIGLIYAIQSDNTVLRLDIFLI